MITTMIMIMAVMIKVMMITTSKEREKDRVIKVGQYAIRSTHYPSMLRSNAVDNMLLCRSFVC